jgi:tetratricopeptide (TPR) repeat protein
MSLCEEFGHKMPFVTSGGACLGYHYTHVNQNLGKALEVLQRTILLFPKDSLPNTNLIYCYKSIGSLYARKRDFDQAISYYEHGLAIRDLAKEDKSLYNHGLRNDLALSYSITGQIEKAKAMQKSLLEDPRVDFSGRGYALNGLADLYSKEAAYTEARKFAQMAIKEALAHYKGDSLNATVINGLCRLADIAIEQGDFNTSISLYKKAVALTANPKANGPKGRPTGKKVFYLGLTYKQANMDSLALLTFQKALTIFIPAFTPQSVYELPEIPIANKEAWITHSLREKARLFLRKYDRTKEQKWVALAFDHAMMAIGQLEKVVFGLNHRASNSYLIDLDYEVK